MATRLAGAGLACAVLLGLGAGRGTAGGDGVPSRVWWLLAAVVIAAGALTWLLLARAARTRTWQEQLLAAEGKGARLARELLPQLRDTGSVEQVAGGWRVPLPQVAAAEDRLTVLQSSAKDVPGGAGAEVLRDAFRDARSRVPAAPSGGAGEMWALDLDEAISRLESALAPDPGGRK